MADLIRDPIDGADYLISSTGWVMATTNPALCPHDAQSAPPPYGDDVRPIASNEYDATALQRECDAAQDALVWRRAHREVAIARVAQVVCPWLVGALIFGAVLYAVGRTAWRDGYRQAQVEQAQRGRP